MQNILIDKPYKYIPPHRGNWWPAFIQHFRLIDRWLKKNHGVVDYEIRNSKLLADSLSAGHGILLAPNHSRPCDPIAMGWLARAVKTHVFAMASWHLFHEDRFTSFAIRKAGGFSVYREGIDRQAINEAINILTTAERPLIIFPEGGVTRTNDRLQALLDGVAFIARSAAKRRRKIDEKKSVVIHPIAMKYLFKGDLDTSLDPILTEIEQRLSWRPQRDLPLMDRITKVGKTLLTLKEIQYLGRPQDDSFETRLQYMVNCLLEPLENEWLSGVQHGGIIARVKSIRMKIMPDMVNGELSEAERNRRWRQLEDCYLAQQVASYPADYLTASPTQDRILETVERFEEDLTDAVRVVGPMKVIIQVGNAIPVGAKRDRTAAEDQLMVQLSTDLQSMLDELSSESRSWEASSAGSQEKHFANQASVARHL